MSDTLGELLGEMPKGMLPSTAPQALPQQAPAPKTKRKGNLTIQTATDGKTTYFPTKYFKQGLGFETEAEAQKAAKLPLSEAARLLTGEKSYLKGDAATPAPAQPATPDPTQTSTPTPAAPAVAQPKPEWVMRREKLGIPYVFDKARGAWIPAAGQRISV